MRNSYWGLALVLGIFFVASTSVVGAQADAPTYPEAAAFAVNGTAVENILADAGLDAAWRSSLDLHPGARALEIQYRGNESDPVEALIRTSFELAATTSLRADVLTELRVAAVHLDDAKKAEREREIDRNRADAYFQGIHALAQSVAINRFAGQDPGASAILGLDGVAMAVAQREFALTNTTLEEMLAQRAAAEIELNDAIDAFDVAVQARRDAKAGHTLLIDEAAALTTTRRELDESARATMAGAAQAFVLADIPGQPGLTPRALSAYLNAEATMAELSPSCHVSWRTIAAVGSVESRHGSYNNGRLGVDGRPAQRIVGLALNGQTVDNFGQTTANLSDTDGGKYDGDPIYDRAVGPMQFIPQTWATWKFDGDGDGDSDPHDIDDAAVATGAYLCHYGSLRYFDNWAVAIFGYNHSGPYVNSVKASLDRVLQLRLPEFEGDETLRQSLPYGAWVPRPDEIPVDPAAIEVAE